jgi:Cytochrome P450
MYLQVLTFLRGHCVLLVLLLVGSRLAYNRYGRGLERFNSPGLASISSFWRVAEVWRYGDQVSSIALHQKYGKVVRMGPKTLSFSQPEAVRDIHGHGGLTQKSDFYLVPQQTAKGRGLRTLFATVDTRWHDDLRKRIFAAFSMTSMRQLEGYADIAIATFLQQLHERFADKSGSRGLVDLPVWLRYYADDSITAVSYGRPIGHMELGKDKNGVLKSVDANGRYLGLVGYMVRSPKCTHPSNFFCDICLGLLQLLVSPSINTYPSCDCGYDLTTYSSLN